MITQAALAAAITEQDWTAVLPIGIVALTGLFALVLDILMGKSSLDRNVAIVLGCLGAGLAGYDIVLQFQTHQIYAAFGGAFISDGMAAMFEGIVLVATAVSLLLYHTFDRRVGAAGGTALILWSACGAMVMCGAGNLLTLFLGLELLSLGLYALCALSDRKIAQESAVKYLILSSLASAVMLYGMALLYGTTGSVTLSDILVPPVGVQLYAVGMGLFFVGVAFKLGMPPFHVWMPDVFEGAPLPVSAFMSVVTKAGMLAVLARIVYSAPESRLMHDMLAPLWFVAALSMIVGNLGALAQTNIKRLLAYSGIAQIGYIVAAFAGATAYGLRYALFYLAAYLFMNLGIFAVAALISHEKEEGAQMVNYAGLGRNRPLLAAAMSFFLIGLAGLPPTAGFMGKILILSSSVNAGFAWLAALLIVGTGISIYAYFKIIRTMYVPLRREPAGALAFARASALPWLAVAVCAVAVIGFTFYPLVPSAVLPLVR